MDEDLVGLFDHTVGSTSEEAATRLPRMMIWSKDAPPEEIAEALLNPEGG